MNYGMYTSEGNIAVAGIVEYALKHNLSWKVVYNNLLDLSKYDRQKYGEAMDTEVRECVYNAIRAYERDEDFYV